MIWHCLLGVWQVTTVSLGITSHRQFGVWWITAVSLWMTWHCPLRIWQVTTISLWMTSRCPLGIWQVITVSLQMTSRWLEGRLGMSDALVPVWNLRVVTWFLFHVSSLVFLPGPLALSVLSFFCQWSILLCFFLQKILNFFLLRGIYIYFLYGSCWATRRWELVGGMCSLLPYGTGICYYTLV